MKYILLFFALVFVRSTCAHAQDAEAFTGENLVKECLVDFPLTYEKKDKEVYTKKAKELKDRELILLTFDKKNKTATYQRLFVCTIPGQKEDIVFLETSEEHFKESGNKQALFTRFFPKTNRYYYADCFDQKKAQLENLKKLKVE